MTRASSWLALLLAAVTAGCAEWPLRFDALWPLEPHDAKESTESKDPRPPPPGAFNEAVSQANIRRTICTTGWSAAVRPPAAFLHEAKARLMKEAGLPPAQSSKYEVDFVVPLGLGGHPRKAENLWLQPVDGPWGARTKDRLEGKLRHMVCSGEITLREARDAVRTDWKMAARYYLSDRDLLMPVE